MLSDATVKNAKPAKNTKGNPKARKLADSQGLYLYVSPARARSYPKAQGAIKDLNSAGQILEVDARYPGPDAQAGSAMKRGLLSR